MAILGKEGHYHPDEKSWQGCKLCQRDDSGNFLYFGLFIFTFAFLWIFIGFIFSI